MASNPRKWMFPTVFLCKDRYERYTIAGWVYDRDDRPAATQWFTDAKDDWEDQIVDFAKRWPIETVLVRYDRRPWVEHTIEQWARKYKRVPQIAAILIVREATRL